MAETSAVRLWTPRASSPQGGSSCARSTWTPWSRVPTPALQTGRDGLAVSFGREAVCADDMREDAFMAYMRALKASGRGAEASAEYEKYARRVVRVRKLPPSARAPRPRQQEHGLLG